MSIVSTVLYSACQCKKERPDYYSTAPALHCVYESRCKTTLTEKRKGCQDRDRVLCCIDSLASFVLCPPFFTLGIVWYAF